MTERKRKTLKRRTMKDIIDKTFILLDVCIDRLCGIQCLLRLSEYKTKIHETRKSLGLIYIRILMF